MTNCIICGNEIKDAGVLIGRGLEPPKYCEACRRNIRSYRAKIAVTRELVAAKVVILDRTFIDALCREGKAADGKIKNMHADIYSLGGPKFGPWGGASHTGKTLFYAYTPLESEKSVLLRKMLKKEEHGGEWIYFVIEDTSEQAELLLKFKFTQIYKTTLKGFGRQFDDHYPIEEPYEAILTGGSSARSGRFGNSWVLYVTEKEKEMK